MKKRQFRKSDLVLKALDRAPSIATLTLAKQLRNAYPEVFTSIEQARTNVRKVRGAHGQANRQKPLAARQRPAADSEQCRKWGALVPDPEPSDWGWRNLPADVEKWLVLVDLHIPYHDKSPLVTALQHADGNCDGVLLLGDVCDFYQLSHFQRDPRRRDVVGEVAAVGQFLDGLQELHPKKIVWKAGNHEVRYERYLMQRAPDLWPLLAEQFSLPKVFDLEQRGIEWIRPQDPIRHHALAILHGHEWGNRFSSPVNPARGAFLKAHECTLQGHEHRSSYHPESTLFGRTVRCWSVGCLCNLHPEYRPLGHKWDQGFAYLTAGSQWAVENHAIINGEVL